MLPQPTLYRRQSPRALLALLVAGGCSGGGDGPPIYPVVGKVLVDGQPAARARITFIRTAGPPGSELPLPYAEADGDGVFRPSTRLTGDGAPAGDYTLTVAWPEIRVDHGEEVAGRDRLGGRYGRPQASPLKVTIREGENVLAPLELKSR